MMKQKIRVAVVQTGSALFDRKKSVTKVVEWMEKAGREKAGLVLFPEAFIPGYPRGLDFGATVGSRTPEGKKLWERYYRNAVDLSSNDLEPVQKAAASLKIYLSLGIIEKSHGTLYCTQVFIGTDGSVAGTHRKIKPTGTERVIWGEGDGSSLTTFRTPFGTVGTLICWENYMPLARMSLYQKGVNIYLAPTADQRDLWPVSMQHIAAEGRCFVLSANQYSTLEDYPGDIIASEDLSPDKVYCRGGSLIAAPDGQIIAGPLYDKEGMLVVDLDMNEVIRGKMDLDVAGHYNRPDIFKFEVYGQPDVKDLE